VLDSSVHELCGTSDPSSKCHRLVTLGGCRLLDGLEEWNREPFKKIVKVTRRSCGRCRARLAGAMKSNSSGIKVWKGSRY
jgi:hypothetical protein